MLKSKKAILLTFTIFTAALTIILVTSPSAAVNCEKNISLIHNTLNDYLNTLKIDFKKHTSPPFNPFEESREIKKISSILDEASKFKYVHGISSSYKLSTQGGDCWAMSDWLYNHIKKTGVDCRIIQYETSLANNHRSVQIKIDGEWVDLPYEMFKFDYRFGAPYSKPGMFIYKH